MCATSTTNPVCQGLRPALFRVQIKNIKLHIVTDIKVTFNSFSVFGFRYLVGGRVFHFTKKSHAKIQPILKLPYTIIVTVGWHARQMRWRASHRCFFPTSGSQIYHFLTNSVRMHAGMHAKSLRHQVFPGGPPSKYYPGPTMLNFRDRTRTGVFIVVWS